MKYFTANRHEINNEKWAAAICATALSNKIEAYEECATLAVQAIDELNEFTPNDNENIDPSEFTIQGYKKLANIFRCAMAAYAGAEARLDFILESVPDVVEFKPSPAALNSVQST